MVRLPTEVSTVCMVTLPWEQTAHLDPLERPGNTGMHGLWLGRLNIHVYSNTPYQIEKFKRFFFVYIALLYS